jgi:hypothetical protein
LPDALGVLEGNPLPMKVRLLQLLLVLLDYPGLQDCQDYLV